MQSLRAPCGSSPGLSLAACRKGSEQQESPCTFLYAATCKANLSGCRKTLRCRSSKWIANRGSGRPVYIAKGRARSQVKASAETPAADAESTTAEGVNKASVTVSLQKEAEFGFQYAIVGGAAALGEWDPSKAAVLDWSDGHVWSKTLELPADSSVEYKFILVNDNMEAVDWQPGGNRIIMTSGGESTVQGQWEEAAIEQIPNQEELNGAPQSMMTSESADTNSKSVLSKVSGKSLARKGTRKKRGAANKSRAAAEEAPEGLVAEADIAPAATPAIERAANAAAEVTADVARSTKSGNSPSSPAKSSDAHSSSGFGLAGVSVVVAVALLAAVAFTPDSAGFIRKGDLKGAVGSALDRLNSGSLTETVGKHSSQLAEGLGGLTKATSDSLGGLSKATEDIQRAAGNHLGGLTKATGESLAGLSKATEGLSKAAGENIAKVTGDLTQTTADTTKVAMVADSEESGGDVSEPASSSSRSAGRVGRGKR